MKVLSACTLCLLLTLGGCASKIEYRDNYYPVKLNPALLTPIQPLPEPVYYIDYVKHYEQAEVGYRQSCNTRLEDLKNAYAD